MKEGKLKHGIARRSLSIGKTIEESDSLTVFSHIHGGRVHGTKGQLDSPDQPQVHLEPPG